MTAVRPEAGFFSLIFPLRHHDAGGTRRMAPGIPGRKVRGLAFFGLPAVYFAVSSSLLTQASFTQTQNSSMAVCSSSYVG